MPRPKGLPKTGGRKAGIANASTVRKMFWEVVAGKDFDPLAKFVDAVNRMTKPREIAWACALMFPYLYPKKREISFSYTEAKFGHTDLSKLSTVEIQSTVIELLTARGFTITPPKLTAASPLPKEIPTDADKPYSPF